MNINKTNEISKTSSKERNPKPVVIPVIPKVTLYTQNNH